MNLLTHITDSINGKHSLLTKRSGRWPTVRKEHLVKQPVCVVCGGTGKLEVHHKKPFHLDPSLELDPNNLITLCESNLGGVNCHLLFGHLGNFKSFNENVEKDADEWNEKIHNRP